MIVYVNGDSYAVTSHGKRYSEFLGEHYKCKVINAAISGSSNSRILRTTLRDLIQLRSQNHVVAFISLSFLMRTELWDPNIVHNKFLNDGEFTSIQPTHSKSWFYDKMDLVDSKYKDFCKQFLLNYNVEAETTKLIQNILLLSSWCKQNQVKCIIFSSALQEPIDYTAPFIKDFYKEMVNDKNIINIFEFSFTEWCLSHKFVPISAYTQNIHGQDYDIGHHDEEAHRAFANFLIEYSNEI